MSIQAALFVVGLVIVLGAYIYFIRFMSRRFSHRIHQSTFDRVERAIIAAIILGVVGMFQPWIFVGYKYGFLLVTLATLSFIVWSHITPATEQYNQAEFSADQ